MLKMADLIEKEADDLAQLECLDKGKPATLTLEKRMQQVVYNFYPLYPKRLRFRPPEYAPFCL